MVVGASVGSGDSVSTGELSSVVAGADGSSVGSPDCSGSADSDGAGVGDASPFPPFQTLLIVVSPLLSPPTASATLFFLNSSKGVSEPIASTKNTPAAAAILPQ